jgi:hypothetical protein
LISLAADDRITLEGYALGNRRLAAGDIAQVTLFWRADETPDRRYRTFIHVVDEGNHIVGQRDAEPGGGALLTTLWTPGEVIADNYGVPIHPATPPGRYRIEIGMYDPQTGERLVTLEGESQVWTEPIDVVRPSAPVPVDALDMQHAEDIPLGELSLLGYDAHKLGFAREPVAPLRPGDVLQVTLYWLAEVEPRSDLHLDIDLVDPDGVGWVTLEADPVGGLPTSQWEAGDIWRGQFSMEIPRTLMPGSYRLRIRLRSADGPATEAYLPAPIRVEP